MVGGKAPQELMRGWGVNLPSIEALRPYHGWGNSRHMQSCGKKARKEVWGNRGGRENMRDRDRGREPGGTLEIQGVLNKGEGE